MSNRLTIEEFKGKLHPDVLRRLEILDFNGSSLPLRARDLKTGEVLTWQKANQLFKNKTGHFRKTHGGAPFNKGSKKDFQNKIDIFLGQGRLEVKEYSGANGEGAVLCLKCGKERVVKQMSQLLRQKTGCPLCEREVFSKEYYQRKLNEVFPKEDYLIVDFLGSNKPVKIKHACGMVITKRDTYKMLQMKGCPACEKAKSRGERDIANFLLKNQVPFITEKTYPDLRGSKYPLRYDFCIKNGEVDLLIEFDGEQHHLTSSSYYSEAGRENDTKKDAYAKEKGYPLLRISYLDFKRINSLILDFLKSNDYPIREYGLSGPETPSSES